MHINGVVAFPSAIRRSSTALTEVERARLARSSGAGDGPGYADIQGTRPQTLAYGLTDSPVGQLAWIVEKFREWTDPAASCRHDGRPGHLLTNVSLYWFTGTAGVLGQPLLRGPRVARGRSNGPRCRPESRSSRGSRHPLVRRRGTVVHWSEFARGGHFAALETPDLLVDDIRGFFRGVR